MECPSCKAPMRDDGRFCRNCGYVLPQQTRDDSALSSTPTSSTRESFTALAQIQLLSEPAPEAASGLLVDASDSLHDVRYPRPLWFRIVRRLAMLVGGFVSAVERVLIYPKRRTLVLCLVAYLVGTIINFFHTKIISFTKVAVTIDLDTLFSSKVIPALPLNQLFSLVWWGHYWWVVLLVTIGVIIGLIATAFFGSVAEEDHERERKELNKRQRPSDSLYDVRYPRPLWFRVVRRLAMLVGGFVSAVYQYFEYEEWRIFVLCLIAYLVDTIISFFFAGIISFTNINLSILFSSEVIQYLPFNQQLFSLDWWGRNWWVVLLIIVGALIAFAAIANVGAVAKKDHEREQNELNDRQRPAGFTLRYAFRTLRNESTISQIAWSPDGTILASCAETVKLWHPATGKLLRTIDTGEYGKNIAWSPDGKIFAVGTYSSVGCWNTQTGKEDNSVSVSRADSVVWSPDGQTLTFTAHDSDIKFFDIKTKQIVSLSNSRRSKQTIAWSPDGKVLASASATYSDPGIQIWDVKTSQLLRTLSYPNKSYGYSSHDASIAWSPDGQILASSDSSTILLWDPHTGRQIGSLEGSSTILCLSFSADSRLLASKCIGDHDIIKLWRTDTWEVVAALNESSYRSAVGVAFHPTKTNVLATLGTAETIIRVWDLDLATLLEDVVAGASPAALTSPSAWSELLAAGTTEALPEIVSPPVRQQDPVESITGKAPEKSSPPVRPQTPVESITGKLPEIPSAPAISEQPVASSETVRYRNAKIILVGDSGVGKSGLGLVLTGQPFAPTESTHGRFVWTFNSQEVDLGGGRKETRETLLWDLAGQPGYRLIHQLHLNEVTVALVIFDARSETDPFAGVYHWYRALRQAQRIQDASALPMKKFLVAARIDRGGTGVSAERVRSLVNELGFDGFFETSAKEGRNITALAKAIRQAINWEAPPFVISTELFQQIKAFLVTEKEAGRLLSSADDLYQTFLRSDRALAKIKDLRAQFDTCIGQVETRGLIRRLSFGNLVLLQPEMLDTYTSALVNAVKDEPDGLGSVAEQQARAGNFPIPTEQRLKNKQQEQLLLIAMVEDLLRYEIALREQADDGPYLVFPSQSTRENPDLPNPKGKAVIFSFEGPVLNVYATLAVRLSHSGLFKKQELWRNAVTYTTRLGGTYGIFLQNNGEGQAELTLFFDKAAREETRFHFEEYIVAHLQRYALLESILRRPIFICPTCSTRLDDVQVTYRRQRGHNWMTCGVCDTKVSLLDREERLVVQPSLIQQMNTTADISRDRAAAQTVLRGKIVTKDFDVFLCHNGEDKAAVRTIGQQLREQGILPWLDEEQLRPGFPWQRLLEQQIGTIKSAAVFVGRKGRGPWQNMALDAFIREFVRRQCPVIPVILTDCKNAPDLPIFLQGMTWVDFRQQDPDPMERLIWGITGEQVKVAP